MPNQPTRLTTEQRGIGGFQPWLSEDAGDLRILKGLNYDFVAAGVRSGFGSCNASQLPDDHGLLPPTNTFHQHDCAITLRGSHVNIVVDKDLTYEYMFEERELQHLDPCIDYPWTRAYVGETYYYAHPNYGIISFDTFTGCWQQHMPESLGISSDIISVASFANRLFILSVDTISWSEIDNGLATTPSHITGSGFQSLNLAEYGTPYGVYATKFGVYIFTSAAIMHGRETDADNPFNFSTHDDSLPALGPQLITPYKSNILYANANGLQIMGRAANNQFINEQLSPLMSDYLRTEIFPKREDAPHGSLMQLRYSQNREQIFLSFRNCNTDLFHYSLVYNIPYEKWSEFNELHETMLTIPSTKKQKHRNFGYINANAELQQFNNDVDVTTQHGQDVQSLISTVIIGPFTAITEIPDRTIRVTQVVIKNAIETSAASLNLLNQVTAKSSRNIHIETPECNPATDQRYKVTCSGNVANSDELFAPNELLLQRRQHVSNYYALNYTATHFNLQITANEQGDYYEIASITLLGRVAGRL